MSPYTGQGVCPGKRIDRPPRVDSTARALQVKGLEAERISVIPPAPISQYPGPTGASGMTMGACGSGNETALSTAYRK
jgi:hypothetical protein